MSRGPGTIERRLRGLFAANPTDAFTTEELIAVAFPGVNRVDKKHRVSVLRAARRIVEADMNWRMSHANSRGGLCIIYNAADLRSYGMYRLMRSNAHVSSWRGGTEFYKSKEQMRAELDGKEAHLISPSGNWYRDVIIHRAERDDDHETAAPLVAAREAEWQAFVETTRKILGRLYPRQRRRARQGA